MKLTDPIIGFRVFDRFADGYHLESIFMEHMWTPGVNHFYCQAGQSHPFPHPACLCGFWGFYSLGELLDNFGGPILGAIKIEGLTVCAEKGFRAEKATLVALSSLTYSYGSDTFQTLAHLYNVPYVKPDQLESVAFEHGVRYEKPKVIIETPIEIPKRSLFSRLFEHEY